MYRFHQHLGGSVAQRLRRGGRLDLSGNLADDGVDIGFGKFAFGVELGAHLFGCSRKQLLEQLCR